MIATLLLLAAASSPPADLTTVGIVVSPRPERCVALLRAGGRTRVAGVGDSAFGGRVVAVTAGLVTLEFASGRLELRLPADAGRSTAPTLPAPRPPAGAADAVAQTMGRLEVQRRLALELPRILSESALAPMVDEGQVKGVALTRVAQGTLLSDAGLRPGDILTRVNDVPIDSLATLVGLLPRLQNETELRADVLRNGQPLTLTVTLK